MSDHGMSWCRQVPEAFGPVEIRSSKSGRGLFATKDLHAGDVVLCGLPLVKAAVIEGSEPLIPALKEAARSMGF